jgi:putative transposase
MRTPDRPKRYWDELKHDVRPIYTAVNADAALVAFEELSAKWEQRYPAIIRLWANAWEEFIPFLDYHVEIRQVLCNTNAIESFSPLEPCRPGATSHGANRH